MNSKRIALGIGIVLAVLTLVAMTAPAMAREDDVVFYLNTSDGNHEISVAPDEVVTIYLYVDAPVNKTAGFEMAIVFDPNVVECVDPWITENESVTNWYMWGYRGVFNDLGKEYIRFNAWDPLGIGPGLLRCGDITLKGLNPGVTTLYLGVYPDDVPPNNNTRIIDVNADFKNWTLAEPFTFTCVGPAEPFEKDLVLGWDLISLPLRPENNSTSEVLSSMAGNYDAVYKYNAETKEFESVLDGTIDPGTGYFVNVTTAGTWSYVGQPYTSMSIGLKEGLNMVGWLNCTKRISGNFTTIEGKYNYNARWNEGYEVYEPQAPEIFNDFEMMDRGNGYWIAAKEDCMLTVSCSG
jgi:hypothetical protein